MEVQHNVSSRPDASRFYLRRLRFAVALTIAVVTLVGFMAGAEALLWFDPSEVAAVPEAASSGQTTSLAGLRLTKEYIYADGRLLAIEDADAAEHPSTDLAVWRPSTGVWWVIGSPAMPQRSVQWGIAGDVPVPGDYDGDGGTDFGVFRATEGRWWFILSGDGSTRTVQFGTAGDLPAQADFDADGKTDIAVFRPSLSTWYLIESSTGAINQKNFGLPGDVPAPSDYDGDGRAELAVWRPSSSVFYCMDRFNQVTSVPMRTSGAEPVPADYDGDGLSDFAVRDGATWVIRRSTDRSFETIEWQTNSDVAVQNDYDGDGRVDVAVWRPSDGTWYIRSSFDGTLRQTQWGAAGDIPVPALYRR